MSREEIYNTIASAVWNNDMADCNNYNNDFDSFRKDFDAICAKAFDGIIFVNGTIIN